MNRNRFIQGLKSDIQFSEKRTPANYSEQHQKVSVEIEMHGCYGRICRVAATGQ